MFLTFGDLSVLKQISLFQIFLFLLFINCLGKVGQEVIENPFFQPKLNIFFLNLEFLTKTGNNQGTLFLQLFRLMISIDLFFLHNFFQVK